MARAKPEKLKRQYVNPEGDGPVVEGARVDGQTTMFGDNEDFHRYWREWQGMPEYVHGDLMPSSALIVNFATPEDRRAFAERIDQPQITPFTRAIWYPRAARAKMFDKRWRDANEALPELDAEEEPLDMEEDEG